MQPLRGENTGAGGAFVRGAYCDVKRLFVGSQTTWGEMINVTMVARKVKMEVRACRSRAAATGDNCAEADLLISA